MSRMIICLGLLLPTLARAASPLLASDSVNPSDRRAWLACGKDADCTSVELGCYYWQPVSKEFAAEMKAAYPPVCAKSVLAGLQPPARCVERLCANGPFTVRFWKLLDSGAQHRFVGQRMRACLQATTHTMNDDDFASWEALYFERVDRSIRGGRVDHDEPLERAAAAAIPCEKIVAWQRAQEQWDDVQARDLPTVRVRVESVAHDYPLDDLYPPLIGYRKEFQRCGRMTTREGATFWGDMRARFTIDPDGAVDPGSFDATYPATAYMRQFIDCASSAFRALTFPRPKDRRPVVTRVLIHLPFAP